MAERFQLQFGALAPPIEEQLRDQGLRLDLTPLSRQFLQQDADDVSRLYVRGLLTKAESDRVRNRLVKKIAKHLQPINPATEEPPSNA
jgi:hypothetical protein